MILGKEPWNKYIDKTEESHRKIYGVDMVYLTKKYGTPLYVLFENIIADNYEKYQHAFEEEYKNHLICYAVKANTSYYVLNLLSKLGSGVDVASEYELQLSLNAGIPTEKIRANGNCKSETYLEECIQKRIIINVDPEDELNIINDISENLGKNANINLRLSGFPIKNITSRAISTSTNWSKFGIDYKRANLVFQKLLKMERLNLNGLMVHIGSQITDISAYYTVLDILINLFRDAQKVGFDISEIDMGGGLGIRYFELEDWKIIKEKIKTTRKENYTWANEFIGYEYNPQLDDLEWIGEELSCEYTPDTFIQRLFNEKYSEGKSFKEKLLEIGTPRFVIEPGRSIVGNAGVTITKIGHVSKTPRGENIVHVDTGVNSHTFGTSVPEQLHRIEIANYILEGEKFETFVAGNLCFTGDLICKIKNKLIRKPMRGDYLLFYDTGAYSDFFASNANCFPRPAKVVVKKDGTQKLLVKREDASDIFHREVSGT
jgi:diaminopimelate decarboxylase